MGLLGDYAEPLQGMTILISTPRASLRCALGWYADARCLRPSRKLGSVLRKPIIISAEQRISDYPAHARAISSSLSISRRTSSGDPSCTVRQSRPDAP
jgi:hypothetical protein